MSNPSITPVRQSQAAPLAPTSDAPSPSVRDNEAELTLPAPPSANFDPRASQGSVLAFGPRFRYANMSEADAQAATNAALKAARDNVASNGFVATPHDFTPQLAFRDELGRNNVRLDRTYHGIPIYGAQAIAHLDEQGRVASITGAPIPAQLGIETKPRITAEAARAAAVASLGATPSRSGRPELVIVQTDDGAYALAYHVEATVEPRNQTPRRTHTFVDAATGAVLPIGYDELHGFLDDDEVQRTRTFLGSRRPTGFSTRPTPTASAIPPGFGQSIYSGVVPLATARQGTSGYVLRDPASGAETRDANNAQAGGLFGGLFGGGSPRAITDNNNQWGEPGDDARAQPGIDAHFASVSYLRYLREMFGRNSIDDRGFKLISNVHVRRNLVNAYWDGTAMNYGDGDGRVAGQMVDPDIAGHEITHGLTGNTSRLIYRGESGALNEAGSDILGSAGLAWFLRGRRDRGIPTDFQIGERAFTPSVDGDALRYMDNPSRDRRNPQSEMYSRDHIRNMYRGEQDKGGVHINSGIANNFFYLLANGGRNPTSGQGPEQGLGMEKALRIYYRAHTVYFTPNTNFAQARQAWERAASDLFGATSPELAAVRASAAAVGIDTPVSFTGTSLVS